MTSDITSDMSANCIVRRRAFLDQAVGRVSSPFDLATSFEASVGNVLLEANLERTYSADPYCQMGGFVKRCRGLNVYFKMGSPKGQRIEDLLVDGAPVQPGARQPARQRGGGVNGTSTNAVADTAAPER